MAILKQQLPKSVTQYDESTAPHRRRSAAFDFSRALSAQFIAWNVGSFN